MLSNLINSAFDERKPITKEELQKVLHVNNKNTLNQMISHLVYFGVIKRYENGLYYIPSSEDKFSHLKPSLSDIVSKKYLEGYQGIRTGAYLLYKYKMTSQVSSYYEILSNNVANSTRSKKLYDGKVIVSHPPFPANEKNIRILELLELIKYMHFSDYSFAQSKQRLSEIYKEFSTDKKEIIDYSNYYKGNKYARFRKVVEEIVNYETA